MAASTTPTPVGPDTTPGTRSWIGALVALIVGLAVGVGAGWLLFTPDSVNPEAEALVRDHLAAWNAGDPDAVLALMTEDAVMLGASGGPYYAAEDGTDGIAYLVEEMSDMDFLMTDGPILSGPEPPITVWTVTLITDEGVDYPGLVTLTIEDVDGTLLIAEHTWDDL